jgi:hypothetical protein
MRSGELCGRNATDGAVWSDLVVAASPSSNLLFRLGERLKPLLVEAFIAEEEKGTGLGMDPRYT